MSFADVDHACFSPVFSFVPGLVQPSAFIIVERAVNSG